MAGRYSDRVGRRMPFVVGLDDLRGRRWSRSRVAQALGVVLAALILTSLGAGICFAPALTLLSDVAESSSLHQGFAAGLSNMAWASGQVIGGVGGGVVASRRRLRGCRAWRSPPCCSSPSPTRSTRWRRRRCAGRGLTG